MRSLPGGSQGRARHLFKHEATLVFNTVMEDASQGLPAPSHDGSLWLITPWRVTVAGHRGWHCRRGRQRWAEKPKLWPTKRQGVGPEK